MYKTPPLVTTTLTPDEIAGKDMAILEKHYKSTYRVDPDKFWSAEKAFKTKFKLDEHDLNRIADIYQIMRDNGFYPGGVGEYGSIRWMVVLKSEVDHMIDTKYPLHAKYFPEEIKDMKKSPKEFVKNIGI